MKLNNHNLKNIFKMKSKIKFLGILSLLLLFTTTVTFAQKKNKKPNVVFMLADNVGYGDVGGAFQDAYTTH